MTAHRARDLDEARALVQALSDAAGWPRCTHPRWTIGEEAAALRARGRGRQVPCPCVDPSDPDPNCLHVVWQAASIAELDGAVYVLADEATLAGLELARLTPEERERAEVRSYRARERAVRRER